MPTLHAYDYAYIRVVPRIEYEEFCNVGVILFCRTKRFLAVALVVRPERLLALAPTLDLAKVDAHLALIPRICAGEGPIGQLERAERFRWIVAPHNTVVQCSPSHTGLCHDPQTTLAQLAHALAA
jgi:hypothetical protein